MGNVGLRGSCLCGHPRTEITLDTFTMTPGREWDLEAGALPSLRAGREWLRQRLDAVAPTRAALTRSATPERLEQQRTFELQPTVSTSGGDKRPGGLRWLVAVGALLTAATVTIGFDRANDATVAPIDVDRIEAAAQEAPVSADSLPLGSLYHVVDQIGARQLWAQGITGDGVNVAVIDTGVAEVESLQGTDKVVAVVDFSSEANNPATRFADSNGHGTFMAGIIAGNEPGSSPETAADNPQQFLGVAPDAGIVSVKVSPRDGSTNTNDVIAGVEWVIDNAADLDIRVLNLSFDSGSSLPYEQDALAATLERAWDAGIVVVTPAGNDGNDAGRLGSPAIDPFVIAVGGARALDDGFEIAEWSNSGDGVRNPDFVAPGAHIQSLRAPGSDADVNHPEGYVDEETFKGSGTSESAAVVSAVAALLLEANPEWTNDQVKAALITTATPIEGATSDVAGAGMIRADLAAQANVAAAPQPWARSTVEKTAPNSETQGVQNILTNVPWTGTSWTGTSWTGTSWTGTSWTGTSWTGTSWT